MTVSVTDSGLRLEDREVPLLSGAVHYWRIERRRWEACLDSVVSLGFPMVETYVPWNVHERAAGSYDFGTADPRKDLGTFLDLAAERGLSAIVRPGPHINAELTYFGYPERILRDESLLARSARGARVLLPVPPRMFPVPSYASERFFEEVRRWYAGVAEVVAPRLHPKGPVVLLQVDNEAALFFRDALFEQDYHPDAIAAFRAFLRDRYGTDQALREAWGDPSVVLETLDPPRARKIERRQDLVRLLDWAAFHEELPRRALERLRGMLGELGLGSVPTSHNLPPGQWAIPMSIPALERSIDVIGIDLYSPRTDHRTLKQRLLLLAGTARLPYSPELGGGAPPWYPQLEPEDARFLAMASMAYGLRGYNLYMAVDRDRWVGAPIDARGTPRVMADEYAALHRAFIDRGLFSMRRRLGALLVVPRTYMRFSRIAHAWGPASPSILEQLGLGPHVSCLEDTFGFPEAVQIAWVDALRAMAGALERAGVAYGYLDGDAEPERFGAAPLLCVPSFDFMSAALVDKLRGAATRGATLVCGPRLPTLDENLRPLGASLEPARVVDHRDAAALDALVAQLAREREARARLWSPDDGVDVTHFEGSDGRQLLFAVRLGPTRCVARLESREGPLPALTDVLTGQPVDPERIELGAFQVRMLEPRS